MTRRDTDARGRGGFLGQRQEELEVLQRGLAVTRQRRVEANFNPHGAVGSAVLGHFAGKAS